MANRSPNSGYNALQFPGQPQANAGQFSGQPEANAGQFIGQSQSNAGQYPEQFQGQFIGQPQTNAGQYPDQAQVNVEQFAGQPQMWRDDLSNHPSNIHNQSNFLQDTGTQVKNMTQGAADIGTAAAQSMVNIARGAATGAAHIAQGAAEAVKNTIGVNSPKATPRQSDRGISPDSPSSRV